MRRGRSSDVESRGTPSETEAHNLPATPFEVREIPRSVAGPFIEKYHYSGTAPTGDNIYFGCYPENGGLFAVVNYGRLACRTEKGGQDEAEATGCPDATVKNTLELRRMCRVGSKENKGPVKLTAILKICHNKLRKSGYRYILSYSDWGASPLASIDPLDPRDPTDMVRPGTRHRSGGVYLFARFKWLGATPEEYHCLDKDGNVVHRSVAYRKMLAHNLKICKKAAFVVERKITGNRDRIWPTDPTLWAMADANPLPADKLWRLDQVRRAMRLTVSKRPPKDKWLLIL